MRKPADQQVLLLSGPIASGKTTLARLLADRFGFCFVSTRGLLRAPVGGHRWFLQAAGAAMDKSTGGRWVADGLGQLRRQCSTDVSFVVDSVRTPDQIWWIREFWGESVKHVHLIADGNVLTNRYSSRVEGYAYWDVIGNPVEQGVNVLAGPAGLVVDTGHLIPELVLGRVAGYLGLVP